MNLDTLCVLFREQFSPYLDGALTGHERQAMASHLDGCPACSAEFNDLLELQESLASLGTMKAPADLQARLRGGLSRRGR